MQETIKELVDKPTAQTEQKFLGTFFEIEKEDFSKASITLDYVDNETKRFAFNNIVKNYHTYKPETELFGKRIDYIIKANSKIVGAIGLGCPVIAMKPRDSFIGWNEEQRLKNLTKIGSNWRFCLMYEKLGSKVLSVFCRQARQDYKRIYNQNLLLIETLVEPPYKGTCYLAAGFVKVGQTTGHTFEVIDSFDTKEHAMQYKEKNSIKNVVNRSFKDGKTFLLKSIVGTKKIIFVKPLHRYFRKELCKL